jgi:putative SOS response-associated peptidase YedK
MCASFLIRANTSEIVEVLDQLFLPHDAEGLGEFADPLGDIDLRVLPHRRCPVFVINDGVLVVRPMQFSLIPSWSPDRRPKFATHNARIESVIEKPTWRVPFAQKHCLVPMTHFLEPIYTGSFANHMVRFFAPEAKGKTSSLQSKFQIMLSVAVWEEWVDRESGEVIESMSLLTSEPLKFVNEIGHDRGLIFLPRELERKWLETGKNTGVQNQSDQISPAQWVSLLQKNRLEPHGLSVESDRVMKAKSL